MLSFDIEIINRGLVDISIYDISGREIDNIVSGVFEAGYHEIMWNAQHQSSGMYIFKIKYGSTIKTQKVLLLK